MSKIFGDPDVIKAAQAVPVGNPASLVNWEAIESLPEMFAGHVVSVEFKPPVSDKDPGDFEPVGGGAYMPSIDLMNRIGDKRGIMGDEFGASEPVMMEIDWNRMTCNFNDPPRMVRYHVGYKSTKQGKVLTEDGSERICDPCVVEYNVFNRICADMFGKEEAATDCYNPAKIKTDANGSRYYESSWNGEVSKKYLKYDSRAKRQAAFDAEMKHAMRKADSKARSLVVRVITGMATGYTAAELKSGVFYFYKITRSEFSVKAEQAARLTALSHGIENNGASRALFGPSEPVSAPEPRNVTPPAAPEPAPAQAAPPASAPETLAAQASALVDQRAELIRVLKVYDSMKLVDATIKETFDKMSAWLEVTADATTSPFWIKAIGVLNDIELKMPPAMKISAAIKR